MTLSVKDQSGATVAVSTTLDSAGNTTMNHNFEGQKTTYSAISTGLVPPASCTDLFVISGSATKTVKITRISVSGTAGTLITLPVFLVRRVSLDTGGTPATSPALPVATPHDSSDAAATAVLNAYTAVPTIVDSSPKYVRAGTVTFGTTAAATVQNALVWTFGDRNGRAFTLRGAAQQACINFSTISVSSGVVCIDIEWTEE